MHSFVERRKEPRSHADFTATVRVLDSQTRLDSRILDYSEEGMAIFSPQPLSYGAPVAVTYRGVLILAEVAYSVPFAAGYRTGLKIDQAMATINAEASVNEVVQDLRDALTTIPSSELPETISAQYVHAAQI